MIATTISSLKGAYNSMFNPFRVGIIAFTPLHGFHPWLFIFISFGDIFIKTKKPHITFNKAEYSIAKRIQGLPVKLSHHLSIKMNRHNSTHKP